MIYSSDKVFEIFKVNIAEEAKQIAKNAINKVAPRSFKSVDCIPGTVNG